MKVIDQTRALCPRCRIWHPAELVREGDCVVAIVHCPVEETRREVSSDADLFLAIRRKSTEGAESSVSPGVAEPPLLLNYLTVTNACDMHCALCLSSAHAGSENAYFLSMEEIVQQASEAQKAGGKVFYLFGGEPSVHPEVLEIVERLTALRMRVNLVTNGIRLGTEEGFAAALRRRGLKRVLIQFDSLDEGTLEKLGRNALDVKRAAIALAVKAGFNIALNCTVTNFNLREIGDLMDYAVGLGGRVHNLQFNTATPVGRLDDALRGSPDRERIVREILVHGPRHGFSEDDLLPLPSYRPWGIRVHPDCGVFFLFLRTPRGLVPLTRLVDAAALYRMMGRCRLKPSIFSICVLPAWYVARAIKPGRRMEALRALAGFLLKPSRHSFLNVTVSNFKISSFLDEARLTRCSTAFLSSSGAVKGCLHFNMDDNHPGSKSHEDACRRRP